MVSDFLYKLHPSPDLSHFITSASPTHKTQTNPGNLSGTKMESWVYPGTVPGNMPTNTDLPEI